MDRLGPVGLARGATTRTQQPLEMMGEKLLEMLSERNREGGQPMPGIIARVPRLSAERPAARGETHCWGSQVMKKLEPLGKSVAHARAARAYQNVPHRLPPTRFHTNRALVVVRDHRDPAAMLLPALTRRVTWPRPRRAQQPPVKSAWPSPRTGGSITTAYIRKPTRYYGFQVGRMTIWHGSFCLFGVRTSVDTYAKGMCLLPAIVSSIRSR